MEIEEHEISCEPGQDVCFGKITILEIDLQRPGKSEQGFLATVEKGKNA